MHGPGHDMPTAPWSRRTVAGVVAWIGLLGVAMTLLGRYHGTAGDPGATPAHWPAGEPRLAPAGLEVLLFVHPRCPCTLRSVDAVADLLQALHQRGVDCGVRVVIRTPGDDPDDDAWRDTPTIRRLDTLGAHAVRFDPGGAIARRWGAVTSGHVAIFDARGRRLLDGGLTPARSHAEDPGVLRTLAAQLANGTSIPARPVFGCPIPDPESGGARPDSLDVDPDRTSPDVPNTAAPTPADTTHAHLPDPRR